MYEMFKVDTRRGSANFPIPRIATLRPILTREMIKVISYYRKLEAEVPRTHLIVKLIENLNISIKRDEFSIASAVMDNAQHSAQILGLVHPYNPKPIRHQGVFYNNSISEIIVAQDFSNVDYAWLKRNWQIVNSIHIATHPFSDVDYGMCNGKYTSSKAGLAVFYIDIPTMMIQYKHWCEDRLAKRNNNLKPGIFVSQIVIPNMISNHMDLCLINRAFDMHEGKVVPRMRRQHPVSLGDHTELVDEVCGKMSHLWTTGEPVEPTHFFSMFPSILKDTLKDSFKIPDIAPNINTRWAMELSVMKYVDFMVRFYNQREPNKLRQISSKIRRDIQSLETTKETRQYIGLGGVDYLRSIKTHLNESF